MDEFIYPGYAGYHRYRVGGRDTNELLDVSWSWGWQVAGLDQKRLITCGQRMGLGQQENENKRALLERAP
jgi:hypothetical protein